MRFGSLFSGIGGLDLGLERAGHKCAWQVEIDPYCQVVLHKHWPDVPKYPDVRTVGDELERVDLICGGFPCQPVSVAGRRRGAADERWLWPEFARILRLLRPRYALLENVPGLLAGGGMAEVLGDLAALGFDAEWDCIPAAAVGAPHLRWRVFIVAHAQRDQLRNEPGRSGWPGRQGAAVAGDDGSAGSLADANGVVGNSATGSMDRRSAVVSAAAGGSELGSPGGSLADAEREGLEERTGVGGDARSQLQAVERDGRAVAEPGGVRRREGSGFFGGLGLARRSWWESEPDVGRVAHGVPARVDRLRALGNAVVPQVAEVIGRRLMEMNR